MSNKITGKEYPLSKVFDADFEYHIPGYQRPYAWTEEEMCDIMTPTNLANVCQELFSGSCTEKRAY